MNSIVLNNVEVKHGVKAIFLGVNLSLPENKYRLKGPNGCGKSTLLRIFSGLQTVAKGTVSINLPADLIADSIKFPSDMTVHAIFALFERYQRTDIVIRDALIKTFSLQQYLYMSFNSLSQGNQQKVRVILGLSGTGSWLFLDEPFNGLDADNEALLTKIISNSKRPMIMVDHSVQRRLDGFKNMEIRDRTICIEP